MNENEDNTSHGLSDEEFTLFAGLLVEQTRNQRAILWQARVSAICTTLLLLAILGVLQ